MTREEIRLIVQQLDGKHKSSQMILDDPRWKRMTIDERFTFLVMLVSEK